MPNNDYILRGDALKAVCEYCSMHGDEGEPCSSRCGYYALVLEIPAAVEPVKHRRWVYDSDHIPHCSECGTIALQRHKLYLEEKIYDVPFMLSKRCPECGAKMFSEPPREEDDDEKP